MRRKVSQPRLNRLEFLKCIRNVLPYDLRKNIYMSVIYCFTFGYCPQTLFFCNERSAEKSVQKM